MKKRSFILVIFLLFYSCSPRLHNYYSGIVIDELDRPISGVLVRELIIDNLPNQSFTDKNGYFKFDVKNSTALLFSKSGYENDTINMVWHQHGETTEFSSILKLDSTQIILKGRNLNTWKFDYAKIKEPTFNTIFDFKFNKNQLFEIWLQNENQDLDGFKIFEDSFYHFGFNGNRNMRYTINKDTIVVYSDDYYKHRTGKIEKLDDNNLTINWKNGGNSHYKKWNKTSSNIK